MEMAKQHLDAFKWFAGLVGAVSTVYGVVQGNVWYLTAAAGYIGFVAAAAIGVVAATGALANKPSYAVPTVIGSVVLGVAMHMLFPFRSDELEGMEGPNALSVLGLVVIGITFLVGVSVYQGWQKAQRAPTKVCPDCANVVLAAARICQHCRHKFDAP
jgi:hypothetical protein